MKTIMETWKKYQEDILTEAVQEPESKYDPRAEEEESDVSWTGSASSSTGTPQTTTPDPKGGGTGPGGTPAPPAKKAALHPRLAGHGKRYGWTPGQQAPLPDDTESKQYRRAVRWNKAQGFKSGKTAAHRAAEAPSRAQPVPQPQEKAVKAKQQAVKPQEKAQPAASQELQPRWIKPDEEPTRAQKRVNVAAGYSPSGHRAKAGLKGLRPKEVSEGLNVSQSRLTELIKQELREIMDLPSDLSAPASEAELKMDALSSGWEKLIADRILDGEAGIWSNTIVADPIDGEGRLLDEFLSILGNYVVSDEIDEGDANDLVRSIADRISDNLFEPSPHEWGIAPPKWEGKPFEPAGRPRRPEGLEEGGRAGHYKGVDVGDVGASTAAEERELAALLGEHSDELVAELQAVVAKWEPQTEEGAAYEADILEILDRWEEPLQLSAPNAEDIERLKQGLRRQKSPRSPGDFRHWRDRWEK